MKSGWLCSSFGNWQTTLVAVVLGAITLAFPAWVKGSAYLFDDSDAYYRAGRSVISTFIGRANVEVPTKTDGIPTTAPTSKQNYEVTLLSARSPYYGIVLYLCSLVAGLWGIVVLNASIASLVLWRTASAFALHNRQMAYGAMVIATAAASSLPWYVSFVMPDIWLGLGTLLLGALLFGIRRPSRFDYALLTILIAAAAAFHRANVAVLLATLLLAIPLALAFGIERDRIWKVLGGTVGLGLVVAFALGAAFNIAAERHFGEKLRIPIFGTARILADGSGRAYLRTACANDAERFALCRFRNLPLDNSEAILWSSDPALGVYTIADYKTRLALSDEQSSFVIAAILSNPAAAAAAALGNATKQLASFGLEEFGENRWLRWSGTPFWNDLAIFEAVPESANCLKSPSACTPPKYIAIFDVIERLAFVCSMALLLLHVSRSWAPGTDSIDRKLAAFAVFAVLAVVTNAAVCGVLSGPHDRYQARLIWIVTALAALIAVLKLNVARKAVMQKAL